MLTSHFVRFPMGITRCRAEMQFILPLGVRIVRAVPIPLAGSARNPAARWVGELAPPSRARTRRVRYRSTQIGVHWAIQHFASSASSALLSSCSHANIAATLSRQRANYPGRRPKTFTITAAPNGLARTLEADMPVVASVTSPRHRASCGRLCRLPVPRNLRLSGGGGVGGGSKGVLLRDVAAGIIGHERRRDDADDSHDRNIDRDSEARSIGREQRAS